MRNKILFTALCFIIVNIIYSQKYDKTFLQNQNKQLKAEIAELNNELAKSKEESKTSILYVTQLNKKIQTRTQLVNNMTREKKFIEDDIYLKQLQINKLNRELGELRKDYGEVLVKSYKNKSVQNKILFVLSAKDFSQTFRRIKYLQLYTDFQNKKSKEIAKKIEIVQKVRSQKEKSVKDKTLLLTQQQNDIKKLDEEKKEKDVIVQQFKKQQGNYLAQIKNKQAQAKKNEQLINKIITEELVALKKQQDLERQRLIEKQKADKAQLALAEKLKKEEAEQKRKAEEARMKVEQATISQKAQAEKLAKLEEQKAKEAEAKRLALEKQQTNEVRTTADLISDNFEANKGRLPWPVDNGSIIIPYGVSRHPIDANIQVDNPGIDIACAQNSKAKAVFDGVVVRIQEMDGNSVIMVSHGDYFSVYNNLNDVYVKKGDKVKRGQPLGHIFTDETGQTIIKFMLYKGAGKQNPTLWLN